MAHQDLDAAPTQRVWTATRLEGQGSHTAWRTCKGNAATSAKTAETSLGTVCGAFEKDNTGAILGLSPESARIGALAVHSAQACPPTSVLPCREGKAAGGICDARTWSTGESEGRGSMRASSMTRRLRCQRAHRGPDSYSIAHLWWALTAACRGGIGPFSTATFHNSGGSSMCLRQGGSLWPLSPLRLTTSWRERLMFPTSYQDAPSASFVPRRSLPCAVNPKP